jgi:hypothetical protein
MQDNANTDDTDSETDSPYIDEEDWQIAFQPYEGEPQAALTLGFLLTELKQSIRDLDMHEALGAIDEAIDCLYEHSDFVVLAANCLGLLSRGNSQLTEKRYYVS